LALVAAALALAGTCSASAAAPATRLTIVLYPQGRDHPDSRRYTLRCNPAAGTVPQPRLACGVLARLEHPFAPTPPGTTCTDLALGPQRALVTGRVRGHRVFARLRAQGGCEIERWRKVIAVVPGFPRTS
jgi:hypothetical protein